MLLRKPTLRQEASALHHWRLLLRRQALALGLLALARHRPLRGEPPLGGSEQHPRLLVDLGLRPRHLRVALVQQQLELLQLAVALEPLLARQEALELRLRPRLPAGSGLRLAHQRVGLGQPGLEQHLLPRLVASELRLLLAVDLGPHQEQVARLRVGLEPLGLVQGQRQRLLEVLAGLSALVLGALLRQRQVGLARRVLGLLPLLGPGASGSQLLGLHQADLSGSTARCVSRREFPIHEFLGALYLIPAA